jgi:Ca2+-binding RTX toxin-like protein
LPLTAATNVAASGVTLTVTKDGATGADDLREADGRDDLLALGGNDTLLALGGRDNLLRGPGEDDVIAGSEQRLSAGDKNLEGGTDNDRIFAGQGSDIALGGAGNYGLIDGKVHETSEDTLSGRPGNDVTVLATCPHLRT